MSGRFAVGISGAGSNLRALRRAERRGLLGGTIGLVFADRPCPGLEFAAQEGIPTALVAPSSYLDKAAWDLALAQTLTGAGVDWIVLAGLMRVLGEHTLAAFPERILNIHPTLLPAYPGAHPVRDTLAGGARVTGVTVHIVDATLDGGPIVAQQPLPLPAGEGLDDLLPRIRALEHQLLPRIVALAMAGAISVRDGRVFIDEQIAADLPRPRRALLSVSDKTGLVEFGRALADLDLDLVSTGGTARTLREAGLEVIDVASVTGFPEMLEGRVKTLHPRIAAGVLADIRSAEHRRQLAAVTIDPFELVVVNLYRFAEAAARPAIDDDSLIEEIDIGGPTLVRAAAKNHANAGISHFPAGDAHDSSAMRESSASPSRSLSATSSRSDCGAWRMSASVSSTRRGASASSPPSTPAASSPRCMAHTLPAHPAGSSSTVTTVTVRASAGATAPRAASAVPSTLRSSTTNVAPLSATSAARSSAVRAGLIITGTTPTLSAPSANAATWADGDATTATRSPATQPAAASDPAEPRCKASASLAVTSSISRRTARPPRPAGGPPSSGPSPPQPAEPGRCRPPAAPPCTRSRRRERR